MALDLNIWTGVGRATKDAEVSYTNSSLAVGKFSIAVNGWKKDDVSFFDVTMFGKLAENLTKYIVKGKRLAIHANLKQDRYTDRDGNKRYKVHLIAQSIQLLDGGETRQVEQMFQSEEDDSFNEGTEF